MSGTSGGVSVDRLSSIDHEILTLLQFHRVLTTPQLIFLTARPERTVDYRLTRLRSASFVDRTRPYAASGSAPYYWWLTRGGARLVEGVSPAPGKASPNPLFLRHSAAIAGLYVALLDVGPHVGLEGPIWHRDETAWEEWSSLRRTHAHLRPDAHFEVDLDVDGEVGRAGGFIEVDFATMDQRRLRAKVARYLDYCRDRAWWHRHPGCPALLLVTTSNTRVSHFLANVERERPSPSHYQERYPIHWEPLVAACARVSAPEEAMSAPVWRTSVADAPSTLPALLPGEVRKHRRLVANVDARRAAQEHHDQIRAIGPLAQERENGRMDQPPGLESQLTQAFEGRLRASDAFDEARRVWSTTAQELERASAILTLAEAVVNGVNDIRIPFLRLVTSPTGSFAKGYADHLATGRSVGAAASK